MFKKRITAYILDEFGYGTRQVDNYEKIKKLFLKNPETIEAIDVVYTKRICFNNLNEISNFLKTKAKNILTKKEEKELPPKPGKGVVIKKAWIICNENGDTLKPPTFSKRKAIKKAWELIEKN